MLQTIRIIASVLLLGAGVAGCGTRAPASPDDGGAAADSGDLAKFSFFVTSVKAMGELSGSQNGFGGDLRYGETGAGAGLRGADKICAAIAERSLPGSSAKQWRAFLSATADENGNQVDAIDRVGEGPWYDRLGRLFASSKANLLAQRPVDADPAIKNDFPNEDGVPNHNPDGTGDVDNHDMLTGSDATGRLYGPTATCKDWTTADGSPANGRPRVGHSWPRGGTTPFPSDDGGMHPWADGGMPPIDDGGMHPWADGGMPPIDGGMPPIDDGGMHPWADGGIPPMGDGGMPPFREDAGSPMGDMEHWMSALDEGGCAPGVNLSEASFPGQDNTVGGGGGYGGIYCFALTP